MGKRLKNTSRSKSPGVAHQLKKLDPGIRVSRISEGVCVEDRRVLITKNEF